MAEYLTITLNIEGEKKVVSLDKNLKEVAKSSKDAQKSINRLSSAFATLSKVAGASVLGGLTAGFFSVKSRIDEALQAAKNFAEILVNQVVSSIKDFQANMLNFKTQVFSDMAVGVQESAGALIDAARQTGDFERALSNVQSVAGATATELEMMRQTAIQMGKESVFSARDAADAMYYLASAGLNAKQTTQALSGVLDFAAATQTDLAQATQIVVSALNSFGLSAKESSKVADIFSNTIRNSQATSEKLGISLRYVGAVAKQLGVPLELVAASLGTLYNRGFEASNAGTALRAIMLRLVKVSGEAKKALQSAGISMESINPQKVGLIPALKNLNSALEGNKNKTKILAQVFGTEAVGGALALMGSLDDLEKMFNKLSTTSEGVASSMAKIQMQNLAGQVTLLASAWESFNLALGGTVQSGAMRVVGSLAKVVGDLATSLDFRGIFAGLNSSLSNLGSAFISNLGNIRGAVSKLLIDLANISKKMVDYIANNLNDLLKAFQIFTSFMSSVGGSLFIGALKSVQAFSKSIEDLRGNFSQILPTFSTLGQVLGQVFGMVARLVLQNISTIQTSLSSLSNLFATALSPQVFSGISQVFSTIVQQIGVIFATLSQVLKSINFQAIATGFQNLGQAVQGFLQWLGQILSDGSAIQGFFNALVLNIQQFGIHWKAIVDFVKSVDWKGIFSSFGAASSIFENFKNVLAGVAADISAKVGNWIASFQNFYQGIVNIFTSIKALFSGFISGITTIVKGIISGFQQIFSGNLIAGFSTMFSSITAGLSQISASFASFFASFNLEGLFTAFSSLTGVLNILTQAFSQLATGGLSGFVNVILQALPNLDGFSKALFVIVSALGSFMIIKSITGLLGLFSSSFTSILSLFTSINPILLTLTGGFTGLVAILGRLPEILKGVDFSPISEGIKQVVEGLANFDLSKITEGFGKIGEGIKQAINNINWQELGNAIINNISTMISTIIPAIVGVFSKIFEAVGNPDFVQQAGQKISQAFQTMFQNLSTSLGGGGIQNLGKAVGNLILEAVKVGIQGLSVAIPTLAQAFGEFLSGVFSAENLGKIISVVGAAIKSAFVLLGETIKNSFSEILNGDLFSGVVSALTPLLVGLFAYEKWLAPVAPVISNGLETLLSTSFGQLGAIAGALLAGLKIGEYLSQIPWVQEFADWLGGVVVDFESKLENFFSSLGNKITNGWQVVSDIFSTAFETFSSVAQTAKDGIEAVFSSIEGSISSALAGIGNLFSSAKETLSVAFSAIWDSLRSAWGGVREWFSGALNTVQAWIDGIKSKFQAAIEAVKGMAKKIKNMLVGNSPPPEGPLKNIDVGAENIAKAWTESFTKGLDVEQIKNALSGAASINVKKPSTTPAPASPKGGINIVINNPQMWTSRDLNEFSKAVKQALNRATAYGF